MREAMRVVPTFRDLSRAECLALLERNHVGRAAYCFRDHVDIQPISYVYSDGWLYGRTEPGEKLVTLKHSHWIAFEVDEVQGPFDWQSVVVRGAMYLPDADGSPLDRQAFAQAIDAIRTIVPRAFEDDDPTPWRHLLFRIHVDEISGRAASSQEGAAIPRR